MVYSLEKSLFYYVSPCKKAYYLPLVPISNDPLFSLEEVAVIYSLYHHGLASISIYYSNYNVKIARNAAYLLHCVLDWVDNNRKYYYLDLLYEQFSLVEAEMHNDLYNGIYRVIFQ